MSQTELMPTPLTYTNRRQLSDFFLLLLELKNEKKKDQVSKQCV